jgi:hypothetical protein
MPDLLTPTTNTDRESPFVDVPYTPPAAAGRPAAVSLAVMLLIVYAVAELRAFRVLFFRQDALAWAAVIDSALCILAYLVCAVALAHLAPWARRATLIMLPIRVAVAYALIIISDFVLAGHAGTYAERAEFLQFALRELGRQFGVTLLTLGPIMILLTRPGVVAMFDARRKESP